MTDGAEPPSNPAVAPFAAGKAWSSGSSHIDRLILETTQNHGINAWQADSRTPSCTHHSIKENKQYMPTGWGRQDDLNSQQAILLDQNSRTPAWQPTAARFAADRQYPCD